MKTNIVTDVYFDNIDLTFSMEKSVVQRWMNDKEYYMLSIYDMDGSGVANITFDECQLSTIKELIEEAGI